MTEPRRQFRLPEADELFLDGLGYRWETITETKLRWLIIREYILPAGYDRATVDIAVRIEPGYPPGKLDMAYFHPWLSRADRHPIPAADSPQQIDGLKWQRWSRHRTPTNPWIEGEDDLASHIHYVEGWLSTEMERVCR